MNGALQELRMLEIGPFKVALMAAMERAMDYTPPLCVRNRDGWLQPSDELERKLELMSIRHRDDQLKKQCDEFIKICNDIDADWKDSSKRLVQQNHGTSNLTFDDIRSHYRSNGNGVANLERLRASYEKLSARLEAVLKHEQ